MSTTGRDQANPTAPAASDDIVAPSPTVLGDVTVPAGGLAYWRSVWSARHTVTFVAAAVAVFTALVSARQNAAGTIATVGTVDFVVLALAALAGAVTLATYVPPVGVPAREHLAGGSCGILPFVAVIAAPLLLAQAPMTGVALVALVACYGMAATKRITDHASC